MIPLEIDGLAAPVYPRWWILAPHSFSSSKRRDASPRQLSGIEPQAQKEQREGVESSEHLELLLVVPRGEGPLMTDLDGEDLVVHRKNDAVADAERKPPRCSAQDRLWHVSQGKEAALI